MRILQMISKNDRYGAQRIFLDQVAALRDRGHDVFVIARGEEGFVTDSVRTLGVPYQGMAMKGLGDFLAIRRFVQDQRIDIIHSSLDRADHLGRLAGWLSRRPAVSTMMVPRVHPGFRFMDRIAVLSRNQQVLLEARKIASQKIQLVRPGIDTKRFSMPDEAKREAWRRKLSASRYSIVLCHISSMLERKAHRVSLEITAACRRLGEEPLLIIVGDPLHGDYYDSLISQSVRDGIRENVFFTGWTADVPELLSLSDFTVLPSENEALGVVLMEGMAAGTPIIARAGEGGAELVNEYKAGYLYSPEEGVSHLAEEIVTLKRAPGRFHSLADRCRTIAGKEFSMASFGERLEELYLNAMSGTAGRRADG
jgi:glycosyltransferase involved in cell wall biosynthesis